jgi:hemolysin III
MRLFACADPLHLLLSTPTDGGPIYTETDMNRFVVEPFNAGSALLFVLIVAYWAWRLRGRFHKHPFISACLPVLFIGGVGGTIYHAFRLSWVFLFMDFMPIVILTIAASFYFWRKVLYRSWQLWVVFPAFLAVMIGSRWLLWQYGSETLRPFVINIGYALTGLMVLIPLFLLLRKTRWRYGGVVLWALACFGLAVLFRTADPWGWFPFGTHWLWHVFGAFACSALIEYVYRLRAVWRVMFPESAPRRQVA